VTSHARTRAIERKIKIPAGFKELILIPETKLDSNKTQGKDDIWFYKHINSNSLYVLKRVSNKRSILVTVFKMKEQNDISSSSSFVKCTEGEDKEPRPLFAKQLVPQRVCVSSTLPSAWSKAGMLVRMPRKGGKSSIFSLSEELGKKL